MSGEKSKLKEESVAEQKSLGALELFIDDFNDFEKSFHAHDFAWWDYVRYKVQYAMIVERGLLGDRETPKQPDSGKISRLVQQLGRIWRLFYRLHFCNNAAFNSLYVSTRRSDDAEAVIVENGWCVLYANKTEKADAPHGAISKVGIDFLVRELARFFRIAPAVEKQVADLEAALNERFETRVDLKNIIITKLRQSYASLWLWRYILRKLPGLHRLVYVNDDQCKALVLLARERGLKTIEVQHGYMGRSHWGFTYPKLIKPLPTLPDEVWISRDTQDLVYPVPMVFIGSKREPVCNQPRDIDVLIAASPARNKELQSLLQTLSGVGLSIAIKLHPVQTECPLPLKKLFPNERIEVIAGTDDIVAAASRSFIFTAINPNSTTVFEAVEAGAALIVFHFNGYKITNMCDRIAATKLDDLQSLPETVKTILEQRKQ